MKDGELFVFSLRKGFEEGFYVKWMSVRLSSLIWSGESGFDRGCMGDKNPEVYLHGLFTYLSPAMEGDALQALWQ